MGPPLLSRAAGRGYRQGMKTLLAAALLAAAIPASSQSVPDAFAALSAQAAAARSGFARFQAAEAPGGAADAAPGAAQAPDFSAQTVDGRTAFLSDYRGQVVVLDFWAPWSPACRSTVPARAALAAAYGATVLGVAVGQGADAARAFAASLPGGAAGETVLTDPDQSVFSAFHGQALPLAVVVDRQGAVVATVTGSGPDAEARVEAAVRDALAR